MSSPDTFNVGEWEHNLGINFYRQQKYTEAEQLFRQSAQQREKLLGDEHVDTLWSRYNLALTLYRQQNYPRS